MPKTRTKKRSLEAAREINRTGYRSFDRIARDLRITELWSEGEDGVWAGLAPGFNAEGCSTLHVCHPFDRRLTVRELVEAMRKEMWFIEVGPTY